MKVDRFDRLETRVKKETKRALRIYCAVNNLTIQQGVELALSKLDLVDQKPGTARHESSK